jgi:hypothetical protein
MNFHEHQTEIIFYGARETLLIYFFSIRIAAHQKFPSIFQLLDQLENVAEKLLEE